MPRVCLFFCGLFTKKFGLNFKGGAAAAAIQPPPHLYARPLALCIFCARDFLALLASRK
jgi:hypothetical protein